MIVIRDIDGSTPFTLYTLDETPKPLCLYFHGFTSDKDEGIMGRGEVLANLGFTVVAVDACMHGKRRNEAVMQLPASKKYRYITDIVIDTAKDVADFYHRFLTFSPYVKKGNIAVFGTSMGAMIGFTLLPFLKEVTTLISIVGTPSLYDLYAHKMQVYGWNRDALLLEKLESLKQYDPLTYLAHHPNISVFMGCGDKDDIVPKDACLRLNLLLNRENCLYKSYDIGHSSNEAMLQDSYDFLVKHHK